MSKRNITSKSGKQLYLNQIFYKGVLYTSSEMQEGYAKIIDNYDIAPTGDAASPRKPLLTSSQSLGENNYIFPVKFKQNVNDYSFVRFKKTITEEEFASDEIRSPLEEVMRTVDIVNRPINSLNEGGISTINEIPYSIINNDTGDNPIEDPYEDYRNNVINHTGLTFMNLTPMILDRWINPETGTDEAEYVLLLYNRQNEPFLEHEQYYPERISIVDGDTFYYSGEKYRLFGIDSTESGYKWHTYAKHILENIFSFSNLSGIEFIEHAIDKYNRHVVEVNLYLWYINNANYYYYKVCLNYNLLRTGLYTINYIDLKNNTQSDKYIECLQFAQDAKFKQFSTIDFDPFYITENKNISISNNNPLLITDDMYIEAVRIVDSYNISPKSSTNTDFVHAVYLDNTDSVAFIGRVIQLKNGETSIFYKGVIILTAVGESKYTINLPEFGGNGDQPNLIDATSSGYNLLNDNMLSVKNKEDEHDTFNILGIAVLNTSNNEIESPVRVINKASMGQKVALKAIINETGFYSYNDITSTDKYGYNITLNKVTYTNSDKTEEILASGHLLNRTPGATTGNTYYSYTLDQNDEDDGDIRLYDVLNDISIKDLSIVDPDGKAILLDQNEYNKTLYTKNNIESETYIRLFYGTLFEIYVRVKVTESTLIIEVIDNFNFINKVIELNDDGTYSFVKRESGIPLELYSQWYVAPFDSSEYTEIQDPVLIYTKEPNSNTLNKSDAWSEVIESDIPINPTDLLYTITNNYSLSFKYTIQPKLQLVIDEDTAPISLHGILLKNTFQEMSVVLPNLSVGTPIEFITDDDLRTNIDFKNATRIEVFNRQLCLYGPYTKSNVLIFSKFENYDYFPFPYGIVGIEEPITWVSNYKDSFTIFGKHNIHMLSGGTAIGDCTLYKIYENLSTHLPDVHCINTVGNNLIFFNNGTGYVLVPNTYVDNPSNIKIYKLTESINNFFYNPEHYIRTRLSDKIDIDDYLTFNFDIKSYTQNNEIILVSNITINIISSDQTINKLPLVVWFIYNQDYKYWRMYSTDSIDFVSTMYICEPNYNNQFISKYEGKSYFSYFITAYNTSYSDKNEQSDINKEIPTMLDSGYLSVDTMNDKRFKDLIIELDNINPEYNLQIDCEFFVDGSPILLSDIDVVTVDKGPNPNKNIDTDKILTDYVNYDLYHIQGYPNPESNTQTIHREFGRPFIVGDKTYTTIGRTHLRIPVYGKGRLPSFVLKIKSEGFYEFINYSLIYKEKNINRRN